MRGGSQGLKNKNFKLINGKPLMYYTIKQAVDSKIFDKIMVSTDSKKILKYAKSYGVDAWFIRPKKFSNNSSSKVAAIKHAFKESEKFYGKKFEFIVDLDATSPLRNVKDIIGAYRNFIKKKADILITGSQSRHNPYFNIVEVVNGRVQIAKELKKNVFRRQDAPKTFDMNASIYIWNRKTLINSKSVNEVLERGVKSKTVLYEMPESRSIDIDSELDFKLVEFLLKKKINLLSNT